MTAQPHSSSLTPSWFSLACSSVCGHPFKLCWCPLPSVLVPMAHLLLQLHLSPDAYGSRICVPCCVLSHMNTYLIVSNCLHDFPPLIPFNWNSVQDYRTKTDFLFPIFPSYLQSELNVLSSSWFSSCPPTPNPVSFGYYLHIEVFPMDYFFLSVPLPLLKSRL